MPHSVLQSRHKHMARRLLIEGITNSLVLHAMATIPRHRFADPAFTNSAYDIQRVMPLPYEQTVSQPLIVAHMTEQLIATEEESMLPKKVLEIGTGSGYQTAILATILPQTLVTIERIKGLHMQAKRTLLQLDQTMLRITPLLLFGDGHQGSIEHTPFDAILLTACASTLPTTLLEQLKIGGRLVAPIQRDGAQKLVVGTKSKEGALVIESTFDVRFVPMQSGVID